MLNQIIQGDVLKVLEILPSESIDCCITSPPYWNLRDYGIDGQLGLERTPEEYVAKMVEVFREVRRVLKKEGTCWLNLGDSYFGNCSRGSNNGRAGFGNKREGVFEKRGNGFKTKDLVGIPWAVAFALRADGWWLRQDIIWHKPNPMPESVTDRCTKSHEYVFLFTKSSKYYFDNQAILEPANYDGRSDTLMKGSDKYKNGFVPNTSPQTVAIKGHERWPHKFRNSDRYIDHNSFNNSKIIGRTETKMVGTGYDGDESGLRGHSGYYDKNGTPRFNQLGGMPARNKRSVWTISTQPFNMWSKSVRLVRVERDAVSCGMMHIVLPACPVHGYLCHQDSNRSGGERVDDATTRIQRNGDPVQSPLFDCAPIDQSHDGGLLSENSDSPPLACFPSATDHSTEKSKTGLVPETTPSCMPCGENDFRIDDTQSPPLSFAPHPCINGSNKWPDEMDVHLPDQTTFYTVDSLSLPIPPECLCGYYHAVTKKSSHFATFPEKLIEPMILAGTSKKGVCPECGKAWVKVVEKTWTKQEQSPKTKAQDIEGNPMYRDGHHNDGLPHKGASKILYWQPTCKCNKEPIPSVVLDPFIGSGTVAVVAKKLGRNYLGIELNKKYIEMANKRIANTFVNRELFD